MVTQTARQRESTEIQDECDQWVNALTATAEKSAVERESPHLERVRAAGSQSRLRLARP